eukprot:scaffold13627_cov99-Skeletonema_marinoi.AAC.3
MMCIQAEAILLHAIIVAPLNETRAMAFFHMILLSPLLIIITAATTFFEDRKSTAEGAESKSWWCWELKTFQGYL